MKTRELNWKENHGIKNTGVEDSRKYNNSRSYRSTANLKEFCHQANRPENLEVETEEEVDEEEKVPYVLHSKVEKATKKTMEKKATTDDNVPVGSRRSQNNEATLNYIHETGEWPKDFIEVTISALKNTPEVPNAATIARSDSLHIQQRWCRRLPRIRPERGLVCWLH